jgi:beta-alanine--pyruvate transaminase
MAAGIATLDVYKEQGVFENAAALAPYWEEGLHSLKDLPHVVDIRNIGMMGSVEFAPIPGPCPQLRTKDIFDRCFAKGLHMRYAACSLTLSPPLVMERKHIDQIVGTIRAAATESAANFKV